MDENLKKFLGNIARNLSSDGSSCQISSLDVIVALSNANGFSCIKNDSDAAIAMKNALQEFCSEGNLETAKCVECVLSACGIVPNSCSSQNVTNASNRAKRMRSWLGVKGISGVGHYDDGGGSPESGEGHFGWNR